MTRYRFAKGKTDANHKAAKEAIEAEGWPLMDLSAAGNGVEDFLVGLSNQDPSTPEMLFWVVVEMKVPRNKAGTIQPSQYKPKQVAWRAKTQGWPRITAVSAEDAVAQIRRMVG